jgi:polyferredoxin
LRFVRIGFQLAFLLAAAWAGARLAFGESGTGVEAFCPFGGLETAWSIVTQRRFSCSAGAMNLSLFVALVALTLAGRRAFCGWVCPVGAISEWTWAGMRRVAGRFRVGIPFEVPRKADRLLRWLRLPVLAAILALTWQAGELVFRAFDPYYVMFSFHGHDVAWWSYLVVGAVLAAGLAFPMAWCRYLCPLAATLWPFAAVARLRLCRDDRTCTHCGACERACPYGLAVSSVAEVRSGDCTLCLKCLKPCPVQGTLQLRARGLRR